MSSDLGATTDTSESLARSIVSPIVHWTGVVMAGGRSARMGTDKAFLRIGNEFLYQRQLILLRDTGASELMLSGTPSTDYPAIAPARLIHDQHPGSGPLAGLVTALQSATHPVIFLLAVDLPGITPALIQQILAAASAATGCVPVVNGRLEPLAAAYPKILLERAQANLAANQNSLQILIREAVSTGSMCTLDIDPADADCFANCNTPAEWSNFLAPQKP